LGQVGVEFDRPSGSDSRVIGVSYEGDPGTAPAEWPGLIGETAQSVERRLGAPVSRRTLDGGDTLYWYASGLALELHAGTVVRIGLAHGDPARH